MTLQACGLLPPPRATLYEGSRGRVYLEAVPDRGTTGAFGAPTGLDASHPANLEPAVLEAFLRGLQIKKSSNFGALLDTSDTPLPIFTKEEAAFLAPHLSEALSKASPSQFAVFELEQPPTGYRAKRVPGAGAGSSIPSPEQVTMEETSGAVYVFGRSLHATLTKFRAVPDRPDTIRMANRLLPDPTGLAEYSVSFTPESALRPDTYAREALPLPSELPSFVIDYQALPHLAAIPPSHQPKSLSPPPSSPPAAATTQSQPAPPTAQGEPDSGEVRELEDLVIEKDLELERLRKELQRLKQQQAPPSPGGPPP